MDGHPPAPRGRKAPSSTPTAQQEEDQNKARMVYRVTCGHDDGPRALEKKTELMNAVIAAVGANIYHNDECSRHFSFWVEAEHPYPLTGMLDADTFVESTKWIESTETKEEPQLQAPE